MINPPVQHDSIRPQLWQRTVPTGANYRLDIKDSTRDASTTANGSRQNHGGFDFLTTVAQRFEPVLTGAKNTLSDALMSAMMSIANLSSITPRQLLDRAITSDHAKSALSTEATAQTAQVVKVFAEDIKVAGDAIEAVKTSTRSLRNKQVVRGVRVTPENRYKIYIPNSLTQFRIITATVLGDFIKINGNRDLPMVRIGIVPIEAQTPITFLYRQYLDHGYKPKEQVSSNKNRALNTNIKKARIGKKVMISGVTGEPFAKAVMAEGKAAAVNLETEAQYGRKLLGGFRRLSNIISTKIERIATESKLSPYEDLAFGKVSADPSRFIEGDLLPEFEMQLKLEEVFRQYGYKIKTGQITTTEGKLSTYIIPVRLNANHTSLKDHIENMRKLIAQCNDIGITLQLAVSNNNVKFITKDKDIGGNIANTLAREISVYCETLKIKTPMLVCDRATVNQLCEEGWTMPHASGQVCKLDGIGDTEILNILEEDIVETEDRTILKSKDKVIDSILYLFDRIHSHLPLLVSFSDKIINELLLYSSIDDINKASSDQIYKLKSLILGILPLIYKKAEFGEIISSISEIALKYRYFDPYLKEIQRSSEPKLTLELMILVSNLVFGRNHDCRELSVKSVFYIDSNKTKVTVDELIAQCVSNSLIQREIIDGVVYLRPNPVIAHYLYITQSEISKRGYHELIAGWLYYENRSSWEAMGENNIDRFRSWALHLGKDGYNLDPSQIRNYAEIMRKGFDYMIECKYFSDYCAIAEPLIIQYEKRPEEEYRKLAFEYRLKLAYCLTRIGDITRAKKVLGNISSELMNDHRYLLYKSIISSNPNNYKDVVEQLASDSEDFYLVLDYIAEKFNGDSKSLVEKKLAEKYNLSQNIRRGKLYRTLLKQNDLKALSILRRLEDIRRKRRQPAYVLSAIVKLNSQSFNPYYRAQAIATSEEARTDGKVAEAMFMSFLNAGDIRTIEKILDRVA